MVKFGTMNKLWILIMSNISQNEVEFSFNGQYLSQLKWLYFFPSQIKQLPQAMEHFPNLGVLQLIDCDALEVLPKAKEH